MNLFESCNLKDIIKITASNPFKRDCEFVRIVIKPVNIKGNNCFQAEKFTKIQAFHTNLKYSDLSDYVNQNVIGNYKQICIVMSEKTVTYLFSSNGKVKKLENLVKTSVQSDYSQNKRKKYIINEGECIPALVDLGIFTRDYKIINSKFDKFKQINRFVEILDDVIKDCNADSLTLLDFGCGKSYLTFVIYHYLVKIRKINARIIGYDIKKDVVDKCNQLAIKYGYDNLQFIVADVTRDKLCEDNIDVVVSLHACDVATDYALHYAVSHKVKYIFSVPCCQHEINNEIHKGGDLDSLIKYGIIKERVSALLTDSIRAMLLEDEGYSVDVMEFVDLTHSPKNLMIRAVKTRSISIKNRKKIEELMQKYAFHQKLYSLMHTDDNRL